MKFENDVDYSFKILVIGDGGVGKSSLVKKYINGTFRDNYIETQAIDPYSTYEEIDDHKIHLNIVDCGGQDRFSLSRSMFFKGAMGSVVCFDLTRQASFDNLENWIQASLKGSNKQKLLLVGLKADLEDYREVSVEAITTLSNQYNAEYFEISSKSHESVNEIFTKVSSLILDDIVQVDESG